MSSKIKEIEARYNKALPEILKELYARLGNQRAVAIELGVGQGTVSLWCKHYRLKIKKVTSFEIVAMEA